MKWDYVIRSFVGLLYPKLCEACGTMLNVHEEVLCLGCLHNMPFTGYWDSPDNPAERKFWGRVPVEHACALFFFKRDSRYRKLVHSLKYHGKKNVGVALGRMLGERLKASPLYQSIELIIPVPLHPKKQWKRGYNQSEMIARGLSQATGWKVNTTALSRGFYTDTQTRIARMDRWDNVSDVFRLTHPEVLKGKQVLLVDDVLTTGSTLEACITQLQKVEGCKISVATLAIVPH